MSDTEDLYAQMLSAMGRGLQHNAIRKLTALLGRRDVISLAAGAPSAETFPVEEIADIAARVIRSRGQFALQYGPTRGTQPLLESIAEMLRARGMLAATPAEIVVTSGSQQGLDLVSRLLIDPGDAALVELPSYIGGIIALHNAGAEQTGVLQDGGGIVIEDMRRQIKRLRADGRRVKLVYTIPNFQNPSGVTLNAERREQLIEVAREMDLLIIEDDPYYDLAFTESRPLPLAALCPERVIYLGSFSKVLAPGLRMAYVRAPQGFAAKLELAKEGADLSTSVLDQAIVSEALRSGLVDRRLPELRTFYDVRCQAMLGALSEFAPRGARWTTPAGGFFILMELAKEVDTAKILPHAIESGVAFVPGQPFFVDGSGANTLRLAYSKETPEKIGEGVALLCAAFKGQHRIEAV